MEAYLCALDEWEHDHRELMLRRSRGNLEIALRHAIGAGPRRSQSTRMPAIEVPAEKDEKDRR